MNQEIVDQLLHIATQKYTDIDNHEKPLLKDDELKKLTIRRGNLTIEERLEIEKHTLYGSKILANADTPLLKMSETIALCHHEKFDGSGYPRGLIGEEIPIEGRIVALADVFDAITSRRVYKRGWSIDEALNFVRNEKGKHFDPNVVDSFFRVLPKITEVMNQMKKNSPQEKDQPEKNSPSI